MGGQSRIDFMIWNSRLGMGDSSDHEPRSTANTSQAQWAFRWLSGLDKEGLMAMLSHKKELNSMEFWEDH